MARHSHAHLQQGRIPMWRLRLSHLGRACVFGSRYEVPRGGISHRPNMSIARQLGDELCCIAREADLRAPLHHVSAELTQPPIAVGLRTLLRSKRLMGSKR